MEKSNKEKKTYFVENPNPLSLKTEEAERSNIAKTAEREKIWNGDGMPYNLHSSVVY